MKSYKIILALGIAALSFASCADKASIKGVLAGAPGKDIVVAHLNINSFSALDTIRTKDDGSFAYDLKVEEGQPEFVYLFYGQTRIAGLLLEAGENVEVKADTLGHFETSGSPGSAKLAEVDAAQLAFAARVEAAGDDKEISKAYIDHYREALKFVMANQKSLCVIPVLFENVAEGFPLFSNSTDAIMFRSTLDSLKTVYPESAYVKSLEKETIRREQSLGVDNILKDAGQLSFPNLNIADINGKKVSLSSVVDANKAVLVHFWSSSDPTHSILNNDALLPVYNEFHSKGFEIYSVCVDPDKAQWGSVVLSQKLPWINVNDGLGAYSSALALYNVSSIPASYIIADGEINTTVDIKGADGLRKELGKLLRQ